tara:strand:- start:1840 stop:2805 length:966 start_codon:yes stop_codon:yes gene_type:complete
MEQKISLKNYVKNGYTISKPLLDEKNIHLIRDLLDKEFKNTEKKSGNGIRINNFKNSELINKIILLFKSPEIQKTIDDLKRISGSEVSLLPFFEVQKNYHVNLKEFHGWHRDCGGELQYSYCKNIIAKKNYLFSKVGVYLQENNEYGGSIDVLLKSHKNFSKFKLLFRKIRSLPYNIITFFHRKFNFLYFSMPESFFMFLLNGKRLFPEKSSAVFFDSRLIHRGSPISKKKLNEIKYVPGKLEAEVPNKKNKYSIYCQFGSTEAVDSYMHDRLKRLNNSNELKDWLDQMEFISKFDKELSNQMNKVLSPIKKKYSNYLAKN